ncbi:3-hydroxypropionyl-coenzyme A dehydratase [Orchesella cincta]|uniref:3-hydroxypropionyl-coenzyme A dehydratase n=1 Tax=Orchesella cincta TaxID=48709 RepID=A0A1D2MHJ5_ORCCI|nr:3-hydroxypropionyl-coenzyme A dehydratase [Orchesella cincta]
MLLQKVISPLSCQQWWPCRRETTRYFLVLSNNERNNMTREKIPSRHKCYSYSTTAAGGSGSGNPNPFLSVGDLKSVRYWTENKGRVAHVMLNRAERLNAIDHHMPMELERAVKIANFDDQVKVILLYGAGNAFSSGYDLKLFSEGKRGEMLGNQEMPWDPLVDFRFMSACTSAFMEIWRSTKPVVAKIHRVAIGGGSDIALACDVTFTEDNARIGYPPSRVWGCPTTAFWFYRVGMEKAKRILLTGEILSGRKAADIGLIGESLETGKELDEAVDDFIARIVTVPSNQLWFQKQMINQAVESMGLLNTQRLATIFDGMSRHTPEGVAFQQRAAQVGFKQAVMERDSGMVAEWSDIKPK